MKESLAEEILRQTVGILTFILLWALYWALRDPASELRLQLADWRYRAREWDRKISNAFEVQRFREELDRMEGVEA